MQIHDSQAEWHEFNLRSVQRHWGGFDLVHAHWSQHGFEDSEGSSVEWWWWPLLMSWPSPDSFMLAVQLPRRKSSTKHTFSTIVLLLFKPISFSCCEEKMPLKRVIYIRIFADGTGPEWIIEHWINSDAFVVFWLLYVKGGTHAQYYALVCLHDC